ncbi:MAG TPA: hypothetical protein P5525_19250 [Candidatus Paceibacterota bacterium]|nr:hypothetical protein [Candidatus Paceibacterota bacterium]
MSRSRRSQGDHRYYLLPGMGRSNRRHRRRILLVAIVVGICGSALFGALLYWVHGR